MTKEKTYCSSECDAFNCLNCFDAKWLILDIDTISGKQGMSMPFIYPTFDDLVDGEEIVRCWECNNQYPRDTYSPIAAPSYEDTVC